MRSTETAMMRPGRPREWHPSSIHPYCPPIILKRSCHLYFVYASYCLMYSPPMKYNILLYNINII